ncbi:quinone oxidoreductase [Hymenopellis radicata]|nr:quinone oxidoreductase [Hymenopellis radicata]
MSMRAILVKDSKGPAENLFMGEMPMPIAGSGQVVVKIKAFGLNRMDIMEREGQYPLPPNAPGILGVEFSGHVAEKGPNTSDAWIIGDEVMGLAVGGAYAEYIAVEQSHLMRKPAHLDWVEAASIPEVFLTAYQGVVVYGELKKGESVLIHAAATGVGMAAIQMARVLGAKNVIATASTKEKLDFLLNMPNGATHAVNYRTEDFAAEVKKITEGKGVDVILDFVGRTHWEKNIASLAVDGRMTMFAFLSGHILPGNVDLSPLLIKRLRIQGSTLRTRSIEYQTDLITRFKNDFVEQITGKDGAGPIRTFVYKVYNWRDIKDAHIEIEANKNIGKIVAEIV